MSGARLALVVGAVAILAGCGGDVANTTPGTAPATATSQGNSPVASQCNPNGIDSSVTDKGADDKIDEGANIAGTTTADGLKFVDLKLGTGAVVQSGQCITVQYTGWLTKGTKFDSSRDRVGGFQFQVGAGNVIKGWDEGIPGMKVGGRRRLAIPPELGYGAQGQGSIPANSTLIFDVEVLKIVG